jgi:hypothetical protein
VNISVLQSPHRKVVGHEHIVGRLKLAMDRYFSN